MKTSAANSISNQRVKSIVFLVLAALLWSIGGMLIKLVTWNPIAIAGMRSAIAAIIFIIVLKRPKITWSMPQVGGAISYAVTVILFVSANKMTTAANAILLQYTAPIYVAILSIWFLKEKTTWLDWTTIAVVIGGMALFFLDDLSAGGLTGNILAIASGVSFAFLAIFLRMQKDSSPLESVLLGNILTAIIGIPFMFSSMPSASSWMGLILLGIFQLGISYVFYALAIKHVSALEAILIPVIEPILNPVWVFIVMGELPGAWAFVGGLIVLIAITGRFLITSINSGIKKESNSSQYI